MRWDSERSVSRGNYKVQPARTTSKRHIVSERIRAYGLRERCRTRRTKARAGRTGASSLVLGLAEELEQLDDVLQAVHVVAQDDPVAHVPVRGVHHPEGGAHDVGRDVGVLHHALLLHGHLHFAQDLGTKEQPR